MIFHRLLMSGNGRVMFMPIIVSPDGNGYTLFEFDTIEGNEFEEAGGVGFHRGAQWQIATDIEFNDILDDRFVTDGELTEIKVGDMNTEMLSDYFIRVKYFSVIDSSKWSDPISFKTDLFEAPLIDWADDIFGALDFGF